jgi:hypothetical protein
MNQFWLIISLLNLMGLISACDGRSADSLYLQQTWDNLTGGNSAQATSPQPYGVAGDITNSEAVVVKGLIAPGTQPSDDGTYYFAHKQSRRAITNRIGFGAYEEHDYGRYSTGGGNYADILYDNDGYAIGVRRSSP